MSSDPFLVFGVELLITRYEVSDERTTLENVNDRTFECNMMPVNILRLMGPAVPAVGTLVGLNCYVGRKGRGPNAVRPGLAAALNATLYGALIARRILNPATNRLQQQQ